MEDEQRIRKIVREELAAQHSNAITITVDSQKIGRAAFETINEVQRSDVRTLLSTKASEDTAALVSLKQK